MRNDALECHESVNKLENGGTISRTFENWAIFWARGGGIRFEIEFQCQKAVKSRNYDGCAVLEK